MAGCRWAGPDTRRPWPSPSRRRAPRRQCSPPPAGSTSWRCRRSGQDGRSHSRRWGRACRCLRVAVGYVKPSAVRTSCCCLWSCAGLFRSRGELSGRDFRRFCWHFAPHTHLRRCPGWPPRPGTPAAGRSPAGECIQRELPEPALRRTGCTPRWPWCCGRGGDESEGSRAEDDTAVVTERVLFRRIFMESPVNGVQAKLTRTECPRG